MCLIGILTEGEKSTWMLFRYGLCVLVYVEIQCSVDAVCLERRGHISLFLNTAYI